MCRKYWLRQQQQPSPRGEFQCPVALATNAATTSAVAATAALASGNKLGEPVGTVPISFCSGVCHGWGGGDQWWRVSVAGSHHSLLAALPEKRRRAIGTGKAVKRFLGCLGRGQTQLLSRESALGTVVVGGWSPQGQGERLRRRGLGALCVVSYGGRDRRVLACWASEKSGEGWAGAGGDRRLPTSRLGAPASKHALAAAAAAAATLIVAVAAAAAVAATRLPMMGFLL
mmetsp:Transcript_71912/g.186722  ORF Transcript_71912/g.186722 Transcript_71912/m.186722 type:complete len:229 (+) Transcript_71912:256-942(+)